MRRASLIAAVALAAGCGHTAPLPTYRLGALAISRVVSPEPVRGGPGGAYFTIMNAGAADSLVRVSSPIADSSSIHEMDEVNGVMTMRPTLGVEIPAQGTVHFAPGHDHVMLEGLRRPLAPGDSLTLVLTFRHAGVIAVRAHVVTYADLESVLGTP